MNKEHHIVKLLILFQDNNTAKQAVIIQNSQLETFENSDYSNI